MSTQINAIVVASGAESFSYQARIALEASVSSLELLIVDGIQGSELDRLSRTPHLFVADLESLDAETIVASTDKLPPHCRRLLVGQDSPQNRAIAEQLNGQLIPNDTSWPQTVVATAKKPISNAPPESADDRDLAGAVWNHVTEGLAVIDSENRVIYSNEAFLHLTRYSPFNVDPFTVDDLVIPAERKSLLGLLAKARRQPLGPVESTLIDSASTPHPAEVRLIALQNNDGRVLVFLRSLALERRLLSEVEELSSSLNDAERLRTLGEMSAGVAHDFNNILGVIIGRLELGQARMVRGEDATDDLKAIRDAADDAKKLVQRIQEFARPNSGEWEIIEPQDFVSKAVDFIKPSVRGEVQLLVDTLPAAPFRCHPSEVREVLLNLINNAADAIEGPGIIKVGCFLDEQATVLYVEDNGVGIPKDVQAKIFEPFFTTKADGGTGLGLSVTRWVLRRHDARIHLKSIPGQGTRFEMHFGSQSTLHATHRAVFEAQSLDVLVVDDDLMVSEMLKDLLEELGHQVTLVHRAEDGLEMSTRRQFDLVLTDLDLPDMSGWQVARLLREEQPGLLIGLISGWSLNEQEAGLRARGVDFLLRKPFSLEALDQALKGFTPNEDVG